MTVQGRGGNADRGLFARLEEDLEQRERMAGLSAADLLDLPRDERAIVRALARRGDMGADDLAHATGLTRGRVVDAARSLGDKSFVRALDVKGHTVYRTYFGRRRVGRVPINLWARLDERVARGVGPEPSSGRGPAGTGADDRPTRSDVDVPGAGAEDDPNG